MEMFNFLPSWITGLTGFGVISWVLLALFAPSALQVASSWLVALSPIVKGLAEALVTFVKLLWEGVKDVMDNLSTVVLVLTLITCTYIYGQVNKPKLDKSQIQQEYLQHLRKNYTLTPKIKGRN